jgi:hypothetical protein
MTKMRLNCAIASLLGLLVAPGFAATQGQPSSAGSTGTFEILFGDPSRTVQVIGLQDATLKQGVTAINTPEGLKFATKDTFCVIDSAKLGVTVKFTPRQQAANGAFLAENSDRSGETIQYAMWAGPVSSGAVVNDDNLVKNGVAIPPIDMVDSPAACGTGNVVKMTWLYGADFPATGKAFVDEVRVTVTPN